MTHTALVGVVMCLLVAQVGQRFSSGVDAVRVDVLVTEKGKPVAGLTVKDFALQDNGVPQELSAFTLGDVPLSMTIALDISGSVAGDLLLRLKQAARAAIGTLNEHDRAALITFSDAVRLRVDWTASTPPLEAEIERAKAGSRTALFDALYAALAAAGSRRAAGRADRRRGVRRRDADCLRERAQRSADVSIRDRAHAAQTITFSAPTDRRRGGRDHGRADLDCAWP
jgi:VWFA-related protein